MISTIESRWTVISILSVLSLIAISFLNSHITNVTAISTLALAISTSIIFIVRRNRLSYAQAEITHEKMERNIAIEIFALILAIGLAGIVSSNVGRDAGAIAESYRPGTGMIPGLASGILAGLSIGFGIRRGVMIFRSRF